MNKRPAMIAAQTERILEQYQVEQVVKGVLASEGAVTIYQVADYLAFAKGVLRLKHIHIGGAQLNGGVAVLLARFKAMGANEAVLIRVRNELTSIPAPAAP